MKQVERGLELQRLFFSKQPRFIGAALSNLKFSEKINVKLRAWIKKPKGMLVFQGCPGIGKTYLCASLVQYFADLKTKGKYRAASLRYFDEYNFLKALRKSVGENREFQDEIEVLIDHDLVILNDLGSNDITPWRKDVTFNLIDCMYNSLKPFVITTNLTREQIVERYEERTASRLFAKENTIIEAFDVDDLRQEGL